MTLKEEHLRKRFKDKLQEICEEHIKGHVVMTFNKDDIVAIVRIFDKLEVFND